MKLWCALVMLIGVAVSTPTFAQPQCCQCGPSACGPALEGGDCSGCTLVPNATCDGDSGLCTAVLEGAIGPTATAPALGGAPLILLAAGMTGLALSLLARRRR